MEDSVQKYATSYFGGSDPKTDSNGTISTFLINSKKYDGSSTSTAVPTYVSLYSSPDWVETFTSDSSTTINLTVPDLRVLNTRTGVLTYHIGTAINAADTGDTIRAWAGTYYENIVVSEEITLEGNGTLTIINGTYSENSIKINPGKSALIPTGLSIAIPDDTEVQIRPRSGLAAKSNIGVLNTPGTIDSDYRGEIKIILFNHGDNEFLVNNNDRVAQMVLTPVLKIEFEEVEDLPKTIRGSGGFGSTGK